MSTAPRAAVILAAGRGKRFPGVESKVLVPLQGRPLVHHVLDAVAQLAGTRVVVVIGHGREAVRAALEGREVEFAEQDVPRGTGHAVLAAAPLLAGFHGTLLVLNGDVPLLRRPSLVDLLEAVEGGGAATALLTAVPPDPRSYGRVRRGPDGRVAAIVEAADADAATLAIREINVGAYAFRAPEVFARLRECSSDNAQGELYLTDAIQRLVAGGERVAAIPVADPLEAEGVNDPAELAALERALS